MSLALNESEEPFQMDLALTIGECSTRGLHSSATWAASLLFEVTIDQEFSLESVASVSSEKASTSRELLALQLMHARKLRQVVSLFCGVSNYTSRELFIYGYAMILVECDREQEDQLPLSQNQANLCSKKSLSMLQELLDLISKFLGTMEDQDAYLMLLKAMVLYRLHRYSDAYCVMYDLLPITPWLFAAWELFSDCFSAAQAHCSDQPMTVPHWNGWGHQLFLLYLSSKRVLSLIDLEKSDTAVDVGPLECSSFARLLRAKCLYEVKEYLHARGILENLLMEHSQMLDGADCLADVLFMLEDEAALKALVSRCVSIEKYHPITCYVVGNFYALIQDHEHAAIYFRRAVRLDCKYSSAWILIAQQFLELRQPESAIDAYRRAIDSAPLDYRGWFGLAQVYDLLDNAQLALEYYYQASQIGIGRSDVRVHMALGACLADAGQLSHAVRSYQTAIQLDPMNAAAQLQLGITLAVHEQKLMAQSDVSMNLSATDSQRHLKKYLDMILTKDDSISDVSLEEHALRRAIIEYASDFASNPSRLDPQTKVKLRQLLIRLLKALDTEGFSSMQEAARKVMDALFPIE